MKKIYLTLLSLLLTFFVIAESSIIRLVRIDIPLSKEKKKKSGYPKQKTKHATPAASLTFLKSVDVDGGGNAKPGSQLNYSILLITSTLMSDLTLKDTLDENLTLVSGSINATPIVVDDQYICIGNVGINVNTIQGGVMANDISPDGKAISVESVTNGLTQNGTYTLNSNGTFTYTPTVGFTGTDRFTYTLKNSNNESSIEQGTVEINVSGLVYFVNSEASSGGNGTLQRPFKNLNEISNTGGNLIYLYSGNYSGSLTLTNNQKLIGQGAVESLPLILNVVLPPFSNPLPTTGTNPIISHNTNSITLGQNNVLYGFDVNTSSGVSVTGSNVGNLKVRNVNLSNTAGKALHISQGGILDCSFTRISASNTTVGISVNNSTGNFQIVGSSNITGSGGTIQNISNRGFEFNNSTNITLKNINFINANTLAGETPGDKNNSNVNAALYFNGVSGITMNNLQMNTSVGNNNGRIGINLYNSSNFSLTDSRILRNGTGSGTAGIFAVNTTGINSISRSEISKTARVARFINENKNMTLNISNSVFSDTRTMHDNNNLNPDGQSALMIEGFGNSEINTTVTQSQFLRYGSQGIAAYANGSSKINAAIIRCTINPGNPNLGPGQDAGTGTDLASSENGGVVMFNILDSKIGGRQGHLVNSFSKGTGRVQGTIERDTVEYNYVGSVQNNAGSGIRVTNTSSDTLNRIKISKNQISGIKSDANYGIDVLVNKASTNGRVDITNVENKVNIGTPTTYAMRMTAAEGSQKICVKVSGNTVNAGTIGLAQFRSVVAGNRFLIEGNNGSQTGEPGVKNIWNNAGNTLTATSTSPNIINAGGLGTFIFGSTCLQPTNPLPLQDLNAFVSINDSISTNLTEPEGTLLSEMPIESKNDFYSIADINDNPQVVVVNGSGSGFSLPANRSTRITFSAVVSNTPTKCAISNTAYVSGTNVLNRASNTVVSNVVIQPPSAITSSNPDVCLGESTSLSSSCTSGSLVWYKSGIVEPLGNETSIIVTPTETATYQATCKVGGCESNKINFNVAVLTLPNVTLQSIPDVCQGATNFAVPYTTTDVGAMTYSITGNGVLSVTNSPLPPSNITVNFINPAVGDSTYKFTVTFKKSNGCISNAIEDSVKVYIIPPPNNPEAIPSVVCTSGPVTLEAENCSGTVLWFNALTNTMITGNQPTVNANTSYYAKCESNGCISDPSSTVNVTVIQPLPTSPGDVPITWTGAVSDEWSEACNWSPAWVPDISNSVVIIPSLLNQPVINSAFVSTIKKLQIDTSSVLSVMGTLNVTSDADTLIRVAGILYNEGIVNVSSSVKSLGVAVLDSGYLLNDLDFTVTTKGIGLSLKNASFLNNDNGILKVFADSSGFVINNTFINLFANGGKITYKGEGNAIDGKLSVLFNIGDLVVESGKGINLSDNSYVYNEECGQILIYQGEYNNADSTLNLGLFQLPDSYNFNGSDKFFNNGVLKANSVTGVENEQMIISDSCPIFTLGSSNSFDVIGIYSDSLLTTLAGHYSASLDKFQAADGLASGVHKLYTEVGDQCSCCSYVVPFNFDNSVPDSVTINQTSVCDGDAIILDANCSSGTVTWYQTDTDNTPLGTGRNFSYVPALGAPSYYYVSCETASCSGSRVITSESVIVKPKPNAPTLSTPVKTEVCLPETISITALGCTESILWSDSSTHNPLVLSAIGVYTISAKCVVDGCASEPSLEIENLKVGNVPDAPTVTDQHVCAGGNITLNATCSTANSTQKWFTEITGDNEISPQLTNVTSNAIYYVGCTSTTISACQSPIVPVNVIVDMPLSSNSNYNFHNHVYGCNGGSTEIILNTYLIVGQPYNVQWQIYNGSIFIDLEESANYQHVKEDTLNLHNLALTDDGTMFKAKISNSCNVIYSDTFYLKINQLPNIITQPQGKTVCVGNQTTLSVEADGSGLSYQWQVNSGSGFVNLTNSSHYANVYTPNLLISNITNDLNNYTYRCVVFNACKSLNSEPASIVVDPTVTILSQPLNRTICQGTNVSFSVTSVNIVNGSLSYQWQVSSDGGLNYSNLSNSTIYSGVDTKTLSLTSVPANLSYFKFRCVMNGYCQTTGAELTVTPIATVNVSPKNVEICEGNNTSFTVQANGVGLTYRWQVNTGSGFVNINDGDIYEGATSSTLNLFYPTSAVNGFQYRCLVWGTSNCDSKADTSAVATLSVGVSAEAQVIIWNSNISQNVGSSQAVGYIFGNNKILQPNGKAEYLAGQSILLQPGFEVQPGAVFEARIKNACQSNHLTGQIPETIKK